MAGFAAGNSFSGAAQMLDNADCPWYAYQRICFHQLARRRRKQDAVPSFGELISEKRKEAGLTQKELAARVCKEDGQAISPQYLNDLEHDRRNPPAPHLIEQLAAALGMEAVLLYHCAGELPPDLACNTTEEETVVAAYEAFRKVVEGENE